MGDIDWNKLYQATSKEDRPTPGYVFNDIVHNVSHANPKAIPAVAEYLADCVDGDHAHVKLKALFVIKTLAYRIPPFCMCMRERLPAVQEAAAFTGPPSALYGDEPYRLVREAAEGALVALTGGEFYHEQYREMSQRIVGFGNFQPDDDTVLPDGSVNVARDVGVKEIAMGTVGIIQSGLGAIFGGVKDMFSGSYSQEKGLGSLGEEDDDDEPEGGGGAGENADAEAANPDQLENDANDPASYQPSAGSYVPPSLPPPAPVDGQRVEESELDEVYDLFKDDESTSCAWLLDEPTLAEPTNAAASSVPNVEEEASFMRLLGINASHPCSDPSGATAPSPGQDTSEKHADMADILGFGSGESDSLATKFAPSAFPTPSKSAAGVDGIPAGDTGSAEGRPSWPAWSPQPEEPSIEQPDSLRRRSLAPVSLSDPNLLEV